MRIALLCVALAACGAGAGKPALIPDDLDPLLAPLQGDLPSLGAAVFSSDGMMAIGAIGVRKLGDPTPVTSIDEWHLGSDTKAMTATLIGIYVAEKKLRWDTTVAEVFPAEKEHLDPGYWPVTIDMLLRHHGGLPADIPREIVQAMDVPGNPRDLRRAAVLSILHLAPASPPGTTYTYANAGYMTAAAMLEQVTGQSWDELIVTRLFEPLGMGSCGFGPPASSGQVDQPWGHDLRTGSPVPTMDDNPVAMGPSGTVHCSLEDWGKFLVLHLRAARGLPVAIPGLDYTRMHTPPAGEDYAYGWVSVERAWGGGAVLTHSGSNTLNYCTVWMAPAIDRAYAVVTNIGGGDTGAKVDAVFGPLLQTYAPSVR